ncbi:MAG: 50S ribosomal protein L9 [Flammeovirgaceae bacterium]|nr:50S ribosomal protein L9 [Flammeovirgaceae bacterium]
MEVILKEYIKGLGYKDDIVNVKPGFGRNYLIPQGIAILATDSTKKVLKENLKQAAHKAEKLKTVAEDLAANIGEMVIEIGAKAGESGKIFGAVTTTQVAEKLNGKGFEIDRKKISFQGDIKNLGEYKVLLDLHKEVKHELTIKVVNA